MFYTNGNINRNYYLFEEETRHEERQREVSNLSERGIGSTKSRGEEDEDK